MAGLIKKSIPVISDFRLALLIIRLFIPNWINTRTVCLKKEAKKRFDSRYTTIQEGINNMSID